ncbi:MAG: ATP-binding protein [Candidatus Thermoplasmatota archaeon]|nr:ATP-binding protein [Candidatus Thermoplasmatota archaeon]
MQTFKRKLVLLFYMDVEKIKNIISDQREEIKRIFAEEKIIDREFLPKWKTSMESSFIKISTGVRRSGKSVFSFQLLKNKEYAYINLDDERLVGLKTSDLNSILEAFYQLYGDFKFIFLDEIQNVEGWELFVNRLKRQGFNVLVTGSNAKLLSKEMATHLTGRHISMEIFPFSFREFLDFEQFNFSKEDFYSTRRKSFLIEKLREYIKIGGFPEVLKNKALSKTYLSTLYSTILSKDVVSRYSVKYATTLKEISNYLVSNFSRLITYNKIKNNFMIKSSHTSKKYVSYLQEPYLFFLLDKFSFKYKEVASSPKKVYVVDTGLINTVAFSSSNNHGRLIENVVAVELLRKKSFDPLLELYYWKDYQQREVDFVLKRGSGVEGLIQVSYVSGRDELNKRELTSLVKASDVLKCKNLLIITWDYEDELQVDNKKIKCLPLWKWLLSS